MTNTATKPIITPEEFANARRTGIYFIDELSAKVPTGEKTMTRRVINPQPDDVILAGENYERKVPVTNKSKLAKKYGVPSSISCRFGGPGDLLYLKENHKIWYDINDHIAVEYMDGATNAFYKKELALVDLRKVLKRKSLGHRKIYGNVSSVWKSATKVSKLFMPEWAARTWMRITDIYPEELGEISEEDAIAEGVWWPAGFDPEEDTPSFMFTHLWESIHGSWNPDLWVWVIKWEVIEKPIFELSKN